MQPYTGQNLEAVGVIKLRYDDLATRDEELRQEWVKTGACWWLSYYSPPGRVLARNMYYCGSAFERNLIGIARVRVLLYAMDVWSNNDGS